jgi:hypothetical protein
MLSSGTQVRGFEPGRSRRIFQGEKNPSEGKSVPCRRFAVCKRSLQMAWKSPFVGKITCHFSPTFTPFPARGLSRRCRSGCTWRFKWVLPKPSSYNKPLKAAVYIRWMEPPGPSRRRSPLQTLSSFVGGQTNRRRFPLLNISYKPSKNTILLC